MKNVKTIYFVLFCFMATLILNCSIVYASPSYTKPVVADGAILIDATSGDILYEKNSNGRFPPASTTKIMTALLTLENCKDLNEKVTVTKDAESIDGSKIFIYENEQITVNDMLHALLLCSANDCAYALSIHIGGTYDNFIAMMNKRAAEIGCKNTTFINPHGLYDDNHRTTAYDLSLIMKELVKHKEYIEISSTLSYNMAPTNKCKNPRPLWNSNKALYKDMSTYYEYTKASKTGYTIQSLHSYVSYAEKDGQKFIVALTHDKEKNFYKDSKALFDFAFKNYKTVQVFKKGDIIKQLQLKDGSINLVTKEDLYITRPMVCSGEPVTNDITLDTESLSSKLIKKDELICNGTVTSDGRNVNFEIVSDRDYAPAKKLEKVSKASENLILKIFKYILFILAYSILALIIFIITRGCLVKYKRLKSKKTSNKRSTS